MSEEPSWDEKASKAAFPVLLKESQRMHAARERPSVQGPFMAAAGWQRDQLRTDEAVERMAVWLFTRSWKPSIDANKGATWWKRSDDESREPWRTEARAAITALLGED